MIGIRHVAIGLATVGLAAASFSFSGCSECGGVVCDPCPPPFTLLVTDADTGLVVHGVEVQGQNGACNVRPDLGHTVCDVWVSVGDSEMALAADGYEDLDLAVTINPDSSETCCGCGYNSKRRDVQMMPLP
jgi:hypothetical protein